jgi:L-ascorbate metabolism protein UlaG (beta-lactamase superfamily)
MRFNYRWLGTAGIAIEAEEQLLAVDPFFSRPRLWQMLRRLQPDPRLVERYLPICDTVLVTHSHYDHLMDVAEVVRRTGAEDYGSVNTCQLLSRMGIPANQLHQVDVGDRLSPGAFEVEVVRGQHSPIPFGWLFNGKLAMEGKAPRYAWDYKMDICLGYSIRLQGMTLLVCSAEPQPAQVLFVVAQEPKDYYMKMLTGVRPQILVPIHWDNFTRPLDKPLRRFSRPGRISLKQLGNLAHQITPACQVIIPIPFVDYPLETNDKTEFKPD